jgi:hypothetical protein
MTARLSSLLLLTALLAVPVSAKDKKKSSLPDYVLKASTVRVVIIPGSGEPLDRPSANATARENVEKALMEWGRLRPVIEGMEADLVIAVRTGTKMGEPTIQGGPVDNRPGVGQSTDSTIRIGAQHGNPTGMGPQNTPQNGPRLGKEMGPSDDTFEVYRGDVEDPLNAPAVWRYIANDCLRAPENTAVEEFRKAIAEAERPKVPKGP